MLEIDQKILDQTTRCSFDFQCLEDESYPLCAAVHSVHEVTEVSDHQDYNCPYAVIFGTSTFCTCPTRAAIRRKYNH